MSELVERLLKRANEDQTCADNSAVVAEALSEQMRLFGAREGHNIYAVRLAVDHQNSVKRDGQYASDLREAAAELTRLQKELETAREDALEEAAQHFASDGAYGAWHSQRVASELRRLKDKEVAG